jgi:hypothetical protein
MRVFAFLNVDSPWISWLVYRGEMVSPKSTGESVLSIWHAKYIIDVARARNSVPNYRRELEIETERKRSFPTKVSRLSGLYFFEDRNSAEIAGHRWNGNFRKEHLAEIEMSPQMVVSRYDSEWITKYMHSNDSSWIQSYLAGKPLGNNPLWELLIEGRGFVLGTSIRKIAYDTVKRAWASSLGLLELARVAVDLESDLGLISPIVTINGDYGHLKMYLNFQDAEKPEFLERLSKYKGPKNIGDLNAQTNLVIPDLSNFFVQFRI